MCHTRIRHVPPTLIWQVLADSSMAKRSSTTGHLLLTCPKVHPIVRSRKPQPKAAPQPKAQLAPPTRGKLTGPAGSDGSGLAGAVNLSAIVTDASLNPNAPQAGGVPKSAEHLGGDWSDEEDVPPLLS